MDTRIWGLTGRRRIRGEQSTQDDAEFVSVRSWVHYWDLDVIGDNWRVWAAHAEFAVSLGLPGKGAQGACEARVYSSGVRSSLETQR